MQINPYLEIIGRSAARVERWALFPAKRQKPLNREFMPGQPFRRPTLVIQRPFPGRFLPGSICFVSLRLHTLPHLHRAVSLAPYPELVDQPTYAFVGSNGLTHIPEIRPLPKRDR